MKHPARTTAAAVLAGLCLIGTPALAHAAEPVAISTQVKAQAPGAIVSKPIVCDDLYGVANGNSVVTKRVDDNKYSMDLVNSKGETVFHTGYRPAEYPGTFKPSDDQYAPYGYQQTDGSFSFTVFDYFPEDRGCFTAFDTKAKEVVLVNQQGDIVARGFDCALILHKDNQALTTQISDDKITFRLINLASGKVISEQQIANDQNANHCEVFYVTNDPAKKDVVAYSPSRRSLTGGITLGYGTVIVDNGTLKIIDDDPFVDNARAASWTRDHVEVNGEDCVLYPIDAKYDSKELYIAQPHRVTPNSEPLHVFIDKSTPLTVDGKQVVFMGGSISRDGAYYVTDGQGHYGSVKPDGSQVLPVKYEGIVDLGKESDPSKIMVKQDGAWYIYDFKAKEQTPTFTDTTADTPHMEDIQWLAQSGISKGFPDGTFRPYASMARCDMAAFLYRLAGEPAFEPTAEDKAAFPDVTDKTDHAKEIWWMASQGIAKGFPDGTFKPYGTIVRQDMAAFLHRMSDVTEGNGAAVDFSDVTDTTPPAEDIAWMAKTGVSEGWKNDNGVEFRGMADVARCDMAAFLHRMETKDLLK